MHKHIIRFLIMIVFCVIGLSAKNAQAEMSQKIKPGQSIAALVKMHQTSYDSTGAQTLTWEAVYALNKGIMIPICTRFDAMKGESKDSWIARGEHGEGVWNGCEKNRQSVWLIAGTRVKIPTAEVSMSSASVQEEPGTKQAPPSIIETAAVAENTHVEKMTWQAYPENRRPYAVAETKIVASSSSLDILHRLNAFVFLPLSLAFVCAMAHVIYLRHSNSKLKAFAQECEKAEELERRAAMIEQAHVRNQQMIAEKGDFQSEDVSKDEERECVSAAFVEQLMCAAMRLQGIQSIVVSSQEEARVVEQLLNVRVTFGPGYFDQLASIEVLQKDSELQKKLAGLTVAELKEFLDLFQSSPVTYQDTAPVPHESPRVFSSTLS